MKQKLNEMIGLDVYFSSLSKEEQKKIQIEMESPKLRMLPLNCWDVSFGLKSENDPTEDELAGLLEFSGEYRWKIDLKRLLFIPHQAVVLTDRNKIIRWASDGFEEMTGHSVDHAIGRSPEFLQGKNTCPESRKRIRAQLNNGEPFTEKIINYRKNGDEYLCKVSIFPMHNDKDEITHFLALESEVV